MMIKCTQKLLAKLGGIDADAAEFSGEDSLLGDWYANSFSIEHKQFVLFLSGKTHLSIVLTKTQANDFPNTFPYALIKHLVWLGVSPDKASDEIERHYRAIRLSKTDGPQAVRYLNSYVMYAKRIGRKCGVTDPVELTQRLAEFPTIKPIIFPDRNTLEAFGESYDLDVLRQKYYR